MVCFTTLLYAWLDVYCIPCDALTKGDQITWGFPGILLHGVNRFSYEYLDKLGHIRSVSRPLGRLASSNATLQAFEQHL